MLYWFLKRVALGPLLRVVYRPRIEGLENIPDDGAAILASNHLSFCDSLFLPVAVPRRVTFLAKAEYFTTPGFKGWLTRMFMGAIGQVPIARDDADAARAAMNTGVALLGKGALLGIYPEGTRSPDGRLYRGKTGVARMALEARVVVIPCAMIDTEKMQPTGRKIPRLHPRPGIRIGTPLDFSRYEGLSGDRFVERSMTDEIMYELMQLSGQEYVDLYAAKVKAATGATVGFGHKPARADARAQALDADRIPDPAGQLSATARPESLVGRSPMRFFYDCEFIEDGRTIELVSIGVVAEDGREFYGVSTEFDPTRANEWVRRHVLEQLPAPASPHWRSRTGIRDELLHFLTASGRRIELWAWMAAYDHVCLAQLWGDMRALARPIPRFTHDLRQRWEDAGSPPLPPAPPDQHDALADARHNLARWRAIEAIRAQPE